MVPFSAAKLAALYPTHAQVAFEWAIDTGRGARLVLAGGAVHYGGEQAGVDVVDVP